MNLSEYVLCTAACISKIIHSTPTSKQGNEKDNKQDLSSPLTSDTYLTISMPMAHWGEKVTKHNKHNSSPKRVLLQQHYDLQAPVGPLPEVDQNLIPVTRHSFVKPCMPKPKKYCAKVKLHVFEEELLAHSVLTHSSNTETCACTLYMETKPVQMFAISANLHLLCTSSSAMHRKFNNYPWVRKNIWSTCIPLNQGETVLCRG